MNYQYHKEYPQIPDHIVQEIYSFLDSQRKDIGEIEEMSKFKTKAFQLDYIDEHHSQESIKQESLGLPGNLILESRPDLSTFYFLDAPEVVKQWVSDNISPNCHASIQEFSEGTFFFPHIDFVRTRAMNYILETGGEDVRTCFWKPKLEWAHLKPIHRTYIPYDRIDLIESIVFPIKKWHSLDVQKIHSVENINPTMKRVALTLSFV